MVKATAKVLIGSGVSNVDARLTAGHWQCVNELESSPTYLPYEYSREIMVLLNSADVDHVCQ